MPMALKYWLLATRPKTLAASLAPVIIGLVLASPYVSIINGYAYITLLCAMLIQIGTNLANDYYDFKKGTDTKQRKGPTRMAQAGHIKPIQLKKVAITVFTLAFIFGLILVYQGGLPILLIGIISIICGFWYTAGPVALAYIGLGDLFALLFFGPIAVGGTYYIQTLTLHSNVIILGIGIGLLATGLITVNNIRDIEEDKQNNKNTLIVRFGTTFGKIEYISCLLLSSYILFTHIPYSNTLLFALIPYSLLIIHNSYKLITKKGEILNKVLAQTGILIISYAIILSIAFLI
ncbi:MAG: 1,4-dihydroxy-2-naphthoate polyprenyltransferase [Rickettsiales bacterium]|nr:1,4-dihydroxy-2-naphthoate polyprenyltransferase [Rickettsiales bacterium]